MPPVEAPPQESGLSRHIGPFPLWVWGLGVGGVAAYLIHKRNQAANTALQLGGATAVTDQAPATDTTTLQGPPATIQTLQQWALAAENALVAHNVNPALASKSIADYLAGNTLNAKESNVISQAFQYAGFPPEVLPFNGNAPTSGLNNPPPVPPITPQQTKLLPIAAPPTHMLPGEHIVDVVRAPEYGASAGYYLTNLGGVYAVGGAKFQGSAFNVLKGFNPQNFASIIDLGKNGYELITQTGQQFVINAQRLVSHT